jgi:mannosyltransferase OCH1-like enzyme
LDRQTIHIIWIGGSVPSEVLQNVDEWKRNFSGKVRLWTDEDLPKFEVSSYFSDSQHPAQKADLLRLEILWKHGGWYIDSDCIPGSKNFPNLGNTAAFAAQDPYVITNGLIYAPKDHHFVKYFLEIAIENIRRYPEENIARTTGPYALGSSFYSYVQKYGLEQCRKQITILPQSDYIHFPFTIKPLLAKKFGKTAIALHYSKNSWNPQTNKKSQSNMKSLLYLVRKLDSSKLTEYLRNFILILIRNRKNPYSFYIMLRLIDQDIASMQSVNHTKNQLLQIDSLSELEIVQQDQYINLIKIPSPEISSRVFECGWKRLNLHRDLYKRIRLVEFLGNN